MLPQTVYTTVYADTNCSKKRWKFFPIHTALHVFYQHNETCLHKAVVTGEGTIVDALLRAAPPDQHADGGKKVATESHGVFLVCFNLCHERGGFQNEFIAHRETESLCVLCEKHPPCEIGIAGRVLAMVRLIPTAVSKGSMTKQCNPSQ